MPGSADTQSMAVGKITGCYGVKGWVKIHAFTEHRENFTALGQWHVKRRNTIEPIAFDEFKLHGKGLIAHIVGIDDRSAAEAYHGLEIVASPDALPALGEGEYYWHQLQGLQVWCTEGNQRELLGTVDYLIDTGANDVLVIKPGEGGKERLVPYLPGDTVKSVDLEQGIVEIDWFLVEE